VKKGKEKTAEKRKENKEKRFRFGGPYKESKKCRNRARKESGPRKGGGMEVKKKKEGSKEPPKKKKKGPSAEKKEKGAL